MTRALRHMAARCLLVLGCWLPSSLVAAAGAVPEVYLFWGEGCPHCERAIEFLKREATRSAHLRVHYFEVTRERGNAELFEAVVKAFDIMRPAVPLIVIGDQVWVGYGVDAQTVAELRTRIASCTAADCPDSVPRLISQLAASPVEGGASTERQAPPSGGPDRMPETLSLPLVGEIRLQDFSLPALTLLLGALDGFNPCAMWTLVFLIGLLVGMKDSLRMWVLGAAFIVGSAVVYFVFMAAWLNILLFLGSLLIMRVAIGLVALVGGGYYLREFALNPDAVCAVTAPQHRQRVFERLRALTRERNFALAFLGIVVLAFLVNLVELICSAGIPVVFTQVLTMSGVPSWQYYGYMVLYILAFMADDLFVFFTAMTTLRVTGLTTRYSRYSHLLGGIVLVTIGALMLLRPQWLMFG